MVIKKNKAASKRTTGNTPGMVGRMMLNQEDQRLKEAQDKKIP